MNRQVTSLSKKLAVLQAAKKLFLTNGFSETSMDAIAITSNVSKQTIYTYFQNKNNLFQKLMEDLCSSTDCPLNDTETFNNPPEKVLTIIGESFLGLVASKEGSALFRFIIAESTRNSHIAKVFYTNAIEKPNLKLTAYLDKLNKSGDFNIHDTAKAAEYFKSIIKGNIYQQALLNVKTPSEAEISSHVSSAVSSFIAYYRK